MYLVDGVDKKDLGEFIQVDHRIMRVDELDIARLGHLAATQVVENECGLPSKSDCKFSLISRLGKNKCLIVEIHGVWSVETGGEIIRQVRGLFDAKEHTALLIDVCDADLQSDITEQYYQVHDMVSAGYHRIGKMAIVSLNSQVRFFENTARNKMIDLRFFREPESAIEWLLRGNIDACGDN